MTSENISPLEKAIRTNGSKRLVARMLRELLEGRTTRVALIILVLGMATLLFVCLTH
jgi:hypothetical protein